MTQKTNTKESGFEEFIENELVNSQGYLSRQSSSYDKALCMDTELVLEFIQKTQNESWAKLAEQYGDEVGEKFLARLDDEVNARGLLDVLRTGVSDRGERFRLAYFKPENSRNSETLADYAGNILSVMRQVKYSAKNENSIDMVLFVNGLPLFTVELKNQFTGQNVINAISQYRTDRDQKERLLSFKRCLTHFAMDTDQAYMTTRLEGLNTYFLPFNKGNKGSSGNPEAPKGKYKTHYLWDEVWVKDSVFDLISNFIQEVVEEKKDKNGKIRREEKIIFPRYHQLEAVRKLVTDAQINGAGKNYLIQHSAGSGKSNTIAWVAHRLAELHNENGQNVFDGVIVVTDRRVLDKQLSDTVKSFSQIVGLVKHVESSAELKEGIEKGTRILTSTLQKFPVIVDSIEKTEGKKFAVIIDEAHSSQSGESAADLRQALTLDEAEKDEEKAEKAFKTVEDQIIERMKARKVASPNLSFFAFTATPKQKTLELFGTEDTLTGKFGPFSLYSMKQAIEEKFILDVLKNYTTYQTYFGLLKKVEDDPEFDKKKAQRLMVGYVERHEHAIDKKVAIMAEHFEEKIAGLINGKAKAMVVTKSRLHAVRYKIAFDKYLKEKGYNHKTLVAFSSTVKDVDTKLEYTEGQMNSIPESQTAEEFKKDEYKFLIVAEKYQTGFDQPLLSVMYVDKKLGGVSAVQTLSRLNRTTYAKQDTFVLDFVNDTDDIKEAFQPYYTTTILSEATNPNILHDLERDVLGFKFFTDFEVNGFIDEYFGNATPDVLNNIIDNVVMRISEENLTAEEMESFKTTVFDYLKKYAFISQIVTFENPQLEKLFIFLKFLVKKLPKRENPLPYEVLEAIDMETYKVEKKVETNVLLENKDGEIDPMGGGGDGHTGPEDEIDMLSKIIKEINDRYGTNFSDSDKVILNDLSLRLLKSDILQGSVKNNSKDSAKLKFDQLFQDELVGVLDNHFNLYQKLDQNPELKKFVQERVFEYVVRKIKV
ncbi:MAG: type restriction enzyme subunit [Patescibacteria group bacterium]|nr:type restriction enzyme subunit [Patescibacteria group bacterium]MDQ5971643.1 type restriction enzyme subunit [Patescibacteria group bacterium]